MAKRFFMTQLWRIQQSYAVLSLFLWGIVITFTAYPIVSPIWFKFLRDYFGLTADTPGIVAATLLFLFFLIYGALYLFGLVYDKYLRLWREQLDVSIERNPYAREKLTVKEVLMWRHMFLPTLRAAASQNPNGQREIEFMERWIERSMVSDDNVRKALKETESWIDSGRAGPK